MAIGYYLVQGDKTTCGGRIIDGASNHSLFGKAIARDRDRVTCGKHPGIYMIAGGIADDSVHGRKMAGTLDSVSTCPCKARFVPSMLQDTYDKNGVCSKSTFSLNRLMALLHDPYKNLHQKKDKPRCTHIDGAVKVAEYIVAEIKKNVRSKTAETIRYNIDTKTLKQRIEEWRKLPFYTRMMIPPPQPDLPSAMIVWYQTVKTGSTWDHKPKIRSQFKNVAVTRLTEKGNVSKSHYHKYKTHDYFLDVWSNIHYGYLGLSVGFDESLLLQGSEWEQQMTPGTKGNDSIDDISCMKIGFDLFRKHGKFAETLYAQDILNALENSGKSKLINSKDTHWCWSEKNPEHTPLPGNLK